MNLDEIKEFLSFETRLDELRATYRATKGATTKRARAEQKATLREALKLNESLAEQLNAKLARMDSFRAKLAGDAQKCRELLDELDSVRRREARKVDSATRSAQLLHRPRNTTSTPSRWSSRSAAPAAVTDRPPPWLDVEGQAAPFADQMVVVWPDLGVVAGRPVSQTDLGDLAHGDQLVECVVDGGQTDLGHHPAGARKYLLGAQVDVITFEGRSTERRWGVMRQPRASSRSDRLHSPQARRSFTPWATRSPNSGSAARKWAMLRSMIPSPTGPR